MNEAPTFYSERGIARARREHKCIECSGAIRVGRSYIKAVGVWDGDMSTYKFHLTCHRIAEEQRHHFRTVGERYDEELPCIGGMVDEAQEDASGGENFPPYWPQGVYVSRKALAQYVEEINDGQDRRNGAQEV